MSDNLDSMTSMMEAISEKSIGDLVSSLPTAYWAASNNIEREQIKALYMARAEEIGKAAVALLGNVVRVVVGETKAEERNATVQEAALRAEQYNIQLEVDKRGVPKDTLNNYRSIMLWDNHYEGIRYNLLKAAPEIHIVDHIRNTLTIKPWEDADEAESQRYIEEQFGLFSDMKHKKALTLLFREREYNPVVDIVDNLPAWDGKERISDFLHKWMGAEDTAYTREVSRLIFAGGINRLYNPGCKFDDVPVLIGTHQGEGKSTIIRWLAIHDDYYAECTQFDGGASVEQLEGAWICEISEMLALKRASEQEAVKAYITRQVDKYRKPYARNPSNLPRRCIFVGSTNVKSFLSDKTGNRRWYPVQVNMSGYDLYDMEKECREYILLCWAEARDKFKIGKMPNFADKNLVAEYREAQAASMEDDWRESAITDYLSKLSVGDRVCVRKVAREALPIDGDIPKDPSRRDAHEIGLIIDKLSDWKRFDGVNRIDDTYGRQRGWIKVSGDSASVDDNETFELPF